MGEDQINGQAKTKHPITQLLRRHELSYINAAGLLDQNTQNQNLKPVKPDTTVKPHTRLSQAIGSRHTPETWLEKRHQARERRAGKREREEEKQRKKAELTGANRSLRTLDSTPIPG